MSCGEVEKYHAILPVSTFTATSAHVNRLSPSPRVPVVNAGVGLPVPKMYSLVAGSYPPGIHVCPPPSRSASRLAHVSSPGSPCFIGTVKQGDPGLETW